MSIDSDFELEFSDVEDPLNFMDSRSWKQRLKSIFTSSRSFIRKWYYVRPFSTGVELRRWTPSESNEYHQRLDAIALTKKKTYIWKWITLVSSLVSILLLSVLIVSSVKRKRSIDTISPSAKSHNGTVWKTLVLSLGGFHPGYINGSETPFLRDLYGSPSLFTDTIVAPYMISSFPTQMLPNHWSMVTGKFPHHHGVIADNFWDSKQSHQFTPKENSTSFLRNTIPFWDLVNEQYGIFSDASLWPSNKHIVRPSLNGQVPPIMEKLKNDTNAVTFVYISEIDYMSKKYGNLIQSGHSRILTELDNFVEQLLNEIDQTINVIIVSDQGVSTVRKDNVYVWETQFGPLNSIPEITKLNDENGADCFIYTGPNDVDTVYAKLSMGVPPHCELVKSTDVFPDVLDSSILLRIPQLMLMCEPGYSLVRQSKYDSMPETFGSFGFSSDEHAMRALFIGKGPFFQQLRSKLNDRYIRPFENVQIFSLLLQLCDAQRVSVAVDADLKFWEHPIPLGKYSESSKTMWEDYPGSEYNFMWNKYEGSPSVTSVGSTTSTPVQPSSTSGGSSFEDILDEVEDTIHNILDKLWPSKGEDSQSAA